MKKYLLLAGAVIAIVLHFEKVDATTQLYFFAISLIITGVPHGSLDYFVEEQTLKHLHQKISLRSFVLGYAANMIAYALCWYIFPTLALAVFIGLTAYHFGEIDWPIRKNTFVDSLLYSLYGLQIIIFIITSHIEEAAPILELIVRHGIARPTWLVWGSVIFYVCIASLFINLVLLTIFKKQLGWNSKTWLQFIAQSVILLCVIYLLPLYLSFGFYFGFWHSLLSFNLIRKQLNLSDTANGWMELIKKAIPFTVVAWAGLIVLISMAFQTNNQLLLLTNLFVGIAILTLPHLRVFTKINA